MLSKRFSIVPEGPAGDEPISWTELADHSRIDSTGERTLLEGYITRAREVAEVYSRRSIVRQRFRLMLDEFPAGGEQIEIPRAPLVDVSAVEYVDGDGDVTTWDTTNWQVDIYSEPGRVKPTNGRAWPTVHSYQLNAARIHFLAGWEPDEVPPRIKQAITLLAAHWYEHREATADRAPREVPYAFSVLMGTADTGELW